MCVYYVFMCVYVYVLPSFIMELGNYLVYAYNNGILEELYQYAIHLQIPLRENVGFYFIYIFSELYA